MDDLFYNGTTKNTWLVSIGPFLVRQRNAGFLLVGVWAPRLPDGDQRPGRLQ
jgi:hypothetical protein